jgi:hypothetical protein
MSSAYGGRDPLQARLASSVVRVDARMVIFHDSRRFELTVAAHYDEWVARLEECVPGRLIPTQHLLRAFDTRQEAITALVRKWHLLFPDAEPLVWREPPAVQPQRLSRKRPHPPRSQE